MAELRYWKWCDEMLDEAHILCAGSTGSGKSVWVNSMLFTLLTYQPNEKQVILIDPKRVELNGYKKVPHCIGYATEVPDIVNQLCKAVATMESRYTEMQKRGLKKWPGSDIYIVVDEMGDLMLTAPKEVDTLITRIMNLGRAAKVHMWICTQSPSRKTITAAIQLNATGKLALRCNSKIESRQIIEMTGAEELPRYGKGIFRNAEGTRVMDIPYTTESDLSDRIQFWTGKPIMKNESPFNSIKKALHLA